VDSVRLELERHSSPPRREGRLKHHGRETRPVGGNGCRL
jgi:hypothetical protein